MPLMSGKGHVSQNISELHRGPQFRRTKKKFGPQSANKQAIAIALKEERKGRSRRGIPKKDIHGYY